MLRKFILSIERNFCCFLLLVVDVAYFGFYLTHTHAIRGGRGRDSLCGSRVRYNSRKFCFTLQILFFFLASFSRCSRIRVSHATKAAPSKCNLLNSPRTCCMFDADSARDKQMGVGCHRTEPRRRVSAGERERANERTYVLCVTTSSSCSCSFDSNICEFTL